MELVERFKPVLQFKDDLRKRKLLRKQLVHLIQNKNNLYSAIIIITILTHPLTVIEDVLSSYIKSIGNLPFVGGGINELIARFVTELHDSIESVPGTSNQTNVKDILMSVLESIEKNAAQNASEVTGQPNEGECIVSAIKVCVHHVYHSLLHAHKLS